MDDNDQYDLVIIGAGASGLSLCLALDDIAYEGKVLIVESAQTYRENKTWCFWHQDDLPAYLQSIITHKWSSWAISCAGESIVHSSHGHPYCIINASDFIDLVESRIQLNSRINVSFETSVESLYFTQNGVTIHSKNRKVFAKKVVDTRHALRQIPSDGLVQCFSGAEIETQVDAFEPSTALIMDELDHGEFGVEFVYILPFTKRRALIEYTCFSKTPIQSETLQTKRNHHLEEFTKDREYKFLREESGVLPMFNIKHQKSNKVMIKGGIAGGAMRASTGYCFQPIQRWAKKVAIALHHNDHLLGFSPIPKTYQWMDDVFLRVISNNMHLGHKILFSFAKGMRSASFARFMSEKATISDLLEVIRVMPKYLFIKGLVGRLLNPQTKAN